MEIKQKLNTLWWGVVLSKIMYLYLWYSTVRETESASNGQKDYILLIMFGVISLLAIFLGRAVSKQYKDTHPILLKIIKEPNDEFSKNLTILTLSLGCVESVAILGLSLSYIYPDKNIFLYFLLASLIGWLLVKPELDEEQ